MVEPRLKSPWWQVTKTPRQGYVLGAVWLVVLLVAVGIGLADGQWPWYQVVLACVAALSTVAYFAGAFVQARSH
jgi:hypothetical protein